MIVCGVDIKAKEAVLAVVQSDSEGWKHVKCETKRLALKDDRDAELLASMKAAIEEFSRDNKIDAFAIKSRQATGTMAAGGITFKIEALFQLSGTQTAFIIPQEIAKLAKSNAVGLPTSVLAYQTDACRAAICHVSKV